MASGEKTGFSSASRYANQLEKVEPEMPVKLTPGIALPHSTKGRLIPRMTMALSASACSAGPTLKPSCESDAAKNGEGGRTHNTESAWERYRREQKRRQVFGFTRPPAASPPPGQMRGQYRSPAPMPHR